MACDQGRGERASDHFQRLCDALAQLLLKSFAEPQRGIGSSRQFGGQGNYGDGRLAAHMRETNFSKSAFAGGVTPLYIIAPTGQPERTHECEQRSLSY